MNNVHDIEAKFVQMPPHPRIIQMESEFYERLIKLEEKSLKKKSDSSIYWMEIMARRDQYRVATGATYEPPIEVNIKEKRVLSQCFEALGGTRWMSNFGWIGSDRTISKPEIKVYEPEVGLWDGVVVNKIGIGKTSSGVAVGLNMNGFGCEGTLPPSLCELEYCSSLFLNQNLLSGPLPSTIYLLERLERLSLSGNQICGKINGPAFSYLKKLQFLDLSFNCLEGEVDEFFKDMVNLKEVDLSGNQFEGNLPISLGKLTQLRVLKLYNNRFQGSLPSSMSQLTSLEHINMSNNQLTAGIIHLTHNSLLRSLQLSYNRFEEVLPVELSQLTALQTLSLQSNQFQGKILQEWCLQWKSLRYLNLSYNELTECLPEEICQMISLESLLLTGNRIQGPVPRSLASMNKLRDLDIFTNIESELIQCERGFRRQVFHRVYEFGPQCGLNNVCYDVKELYGDLTEDQPETTIAHEPFNQEKKKKSKKKSGKHAKKLKKKVMFEGNPIEE